MQIYGNGATIFYRYNKWYEKRYWFWLSLPFRMAREWRRADYMKPYGFDAMLYHCWWVAAKQIRWCVSNKPFFGVLTGKEPPEFYA